MRRREQRNAKRAKAAAPSIAPSQIPTLAQYTIGSLIRHVYGEDCTVLIEQFGLVPTFNRALQKFAEQYASTLVTEVASEAEDKSLLLVMPSFQAISLHKKQNLRQYFH